MVRIFPTALAATALCLGASTPSVDALAKPTAPQLQWQEAEIGVIIHFNMATMANSQGCSQSSAPPDVSLWNASQLNTDQWVEAMTNLGAKYAVYVAKHGCGFCTWPSEVTVPSGDVYPYSVKYAADTTDVVQSFVDSCRAKGIKPGFYYSLGSNAYAKNVLKLSSDDFNNLVLNQTHELWSKYGSLFEIWCVVPCFRCLLP